MTEARKTFLDFWGLSIEVGHSLAEEIARAAGIKPNQINAWIRLRNRKIIERKEQDAEFN